MIYIKTRHDGAVYVITTTMWSSFCNGQLFYLLPVDKKEFKSLCRHDLYIREHYANRRSNCSGINITKKNIAELVDYCLTIYLREKAYYIMPTISADILMSSAEVKKLFFIVHYTIGYGEENYTVLVRRERVKAYTREDMITRGHTGTPRGNFTYNKTYVDTIHRNKRTGSTARKEIEDAIKSLKLHDDFSVTVDNIKRLSVDLLRKRDYWGQSGKGGRHIRSRYSVRTNIIAGNKVSIREPGYKYKNIKHIVKHPIDVLTDLIFPAMLLRHKHARGIWNEQLSTNITPALHLLHNNENLFSAALESIFVSIIKHIAYNINLSEGDVVIPSSNSHCVWLSDNMDHNTQDRDAPASKFGTGTIINMILQENNKGVYSRRLYSGRMIYYRVCPIMAGNFNHGDHPTFIAIISTKPIQETVV